MADDKNFVAMVSGESDEQTRAFNTYDVRSAIVQTEQANANELHADETSDGSRTAEAETSSSRKPHREKVDRGSDEYLNTHPRVGAVVAAIVTGVLLLAGCIAVFYAGIWTLNGQWLDYWVFTKFSSVMPHLKTPLLAIFIDSRLIIGISVVMIALALLITLLRKRYFNLGVISVFVAVAFAVSFTVKRIPHLRPVLDSLIPDPLNSAPSGHTALTVIAGMALLMAVPRAARALAAIWSAFFTSMVGMMVVNFKWHRPTDVYTAILLVGALALIAMSFTRGSGLDPVGKRVSSASVQIVSTAFIILGTAGGLYGAYVVSQVYDVIQYQPDSFTSVVSFATLSAIFGLSMLVYGVALAIRQSTASPLTRLGLIGNPPAPPTVAGKTEKSRKPGKKA